MMRKSTGPLMGAAAIGAAAMVNPILREKHFRSEKREPLVWEPGPGERVLLKNAEVIDVVGGQVLHKRGLLMKDGCIEDVLTEKKAATAKADKVIDAAGAYVIPGLINAHCHTLLTATLSFTPEIISSMKRQFERNFEECITHGITTVRDMGSLPLLLGRFAGRIEKGELLGPRVYHSGSFINAPGGYPDFLPAMPSAITDKLGSFGLPVKTPQEARDAVEKNLEVGASLIKTAFDDHSLFVGEKPLPILGDDSLEAMVKAAHERGLKVTAHHRFRMGFQRCNRFGFDGIEHLAADEVLTDAEVDDFASAGRYVVPTISVGWALSGHSHGDPYLDDPLVKRAMANRLEILRTIYPALFEPPIYRAIMRFESNSQDPDYTERRHLMYTVEPKIFTKALVIGRENLNMLYHAGALIGCGNDGGVPQVTPGILGVEMVLMSIDTDLQPMDVLRAATINNARIIGVEDELGSVEKGKLADLVVLSGNPLENMEQVIYPSAVFKEGRLVYSDSRLEFE
jgi:imidazolonepropionase-like amidohydrolase